MTRPPGQPAGEDCGAFTLVYLIANTIMNVTTQDDQLAVFANAVQIYQLRAAEAGTKSTIKAHLSP
jgi:hypothetical protein